MHQCEYQTKMNNEHLKRLFAFVNILAAATTRVINAILKILPWFMMSQGNLSLLSTLNTWLGSGSHFTFLITIAQDEPSLIQQS